ncbi:unnamed protein product [Cunninghamella echinulata]
MVYTIKVTKVHHPVELTYDGEGLRIDGDFNAQKKAKPKYTCGCIPLPPTKLPIQPYYLLITLIFYES